jgi:hypothetical protein
MPSSSACRDRARAPPLLLPPRGAPELTPPIFFPDAARAPFLFPLNSNRQRPVPGAAPRHRTAPASELAVRGGPDRSPHPRTTSPGASSVGSRRRAPRRPGASRPHRVVVLRAVVPGPPQLHPPVPHFGEPTSSPFMVISSPQCCLPRLGPVPQSPPLSSLVCASCSSPRS